MRISSMAALCLWSTVALAAGPEVVDLTTTDRTIVREPVYQRQPHYALFVFGMKAEHRSWFVVDGDSVAYIDRNGDGDLTDPEDRVELDVESTKKIRLGGTGAYLAMHVFPLGDVFGTRLHFRLWVRNPAYDASQDKLHRDHFREYDEKKWVNGSLMRVAKDKTESQNPLLLTIRPAEAQISHFDGPLTFALAFGEMQELQPWPKRSSFEVNIGCRNLPAKDCHSHSFLLTRLTTTEIPADVHPIATLTYQGFRKTVSQLFRL